MEDKKYTVGEVCKILNVKPYIVRYMDKALNLDIKRDEFSNRLYSTEDLDKLKSIKDLREQGIPYKKIKNIIENKQIAVKTPEELNALILYNPQLKKVLELFSDNISININNLLSPELNKIENKIDKINKENLQLKNVLEIEQEKHYKQLDEKLTKWREESFNKKRGLFHFKHKK